MSLPVLKVNPEEASISKVVVIAFVCVCVCV